MGDRLKRVLIVDDEEDLTWTLSKKLSKDSDKFDLMCVNSGREAMEMLDQVPFDLVITDVRMPEVNGLELLKQIKDSYPSTKVMIMTAYGTSDVQKEATARGCIDYIEKPFEINELRQLIIDALAQRRGFTGSVSDFQLSDIIQLNCLGRLTSALRVVCEGEEGFIYFQEGNIVHAETRYLEGEYAFYHMMNWQGGEFQVLRNQTPPRESISKGWQSLLLESMRRIDENSDLAKREIEQKKQQRLQQLHTIVSKISGVSHVDHVMIHSKVGFPLYYEGQYSGRTELVSDLGNQCSQLMDTVLKSARFLKAGRLDLWELRFAHRVLILQKIPNKDAFLSIIGGENVNVSDIREEIKTHLPALSKLL